jgi:hypothetical protein
MQARVPCLRWWRVGVACGRLCNLMCLNNRWPIALRLTKMREMDVNESLSHPSAEIFVSKPLPYIRFASGSKSTLTKKWRTPAPTYTHLGVGPTCHWQWVPLSTTEEWFPTHPSPCWCWVACCLGGRTSTSTDAADSNSNNMYSRRRRSTSQRPKVVARARGNVGASVPADLFFCAHLLPPSPLNINNLSLVSMCHILA